MRRQRPRPARAHRRRSDRVSGDRQAEPRLAAELEGRDDAGEVVGVGREQARADQPRQRESAARPARRARSPRCRRPTRPARAPRPSIVQSGSSRRARPARAIWSTGSGRVAVLRQRHAVLLAHDHEAQPGPQASRSASALAGREQPRKVGAVELDAREVIRLEVAGAGRRVRAHHLIRRRCRRRRPARAGAPAPAASASR